uniref:Uncharacterized protein LOC113796932 n=1 Tax=Dermatophagoides pteronyssinus TaxID=6956 RepID=A0A6P6YC72_DERPT|nr:uncharacterized protein LOC113796932 [Dermatophagoides pteronyssinus]
MCNRIRYQIINLYINVCGIDVGEQYVRMMSKETLNNRLGLLANFEKQVKKLHLFDDHQDDKYLDLEWKKWFKFSNEMCIKLRIYCVDRFDNELSNEMRNELKQILNIPNDWNKENNQSTKQIDQFIQMIKTLQELWYVVESVHETIMKNGCHDYFIWLCGEFSKILIFHNNATSAKDSFTFVHLFSTKCRIVFFDFCREGIYQGYNDNVRMINSELITKLCRSDFLPKNLIFVCCKYLLKLKKKIHIKCFIRIIQWFDLKLFIHFLMKTYTNESKQKYIRSIFDDIDHIIESKHQSPSNHQLSTKMISTLKQILELKKKLEV